ncbi:MAG: sulfite reductase [Chlamydiia bacterium]|nr:sulfite reductase [Chlamydiia bacterium]
MAHNRSNPFFSRILDRRRLNASSSDKVTMHLTLDLAGSGITYRPGDSVAVVPVNSPELVERTLSWLAFSGSEDGDSLRFRLARERDLARCSRALAKAIAPFLSREKKGALLLELIESDDKALKEYLGDYFVWDFLEEHLATPVPFELIIANLFPLLPRFYSIASSQCRNTDRVDLLVALTEYTSNGHRRFGICSHYLCCHAPLESPVALYPHPTRDFLLVGDDTPIIMIGPGTGVAPFRSFMQERECRGVSGKSWLFFGERRKESDYLYRGEWQEWERSLGLKVTTAFSRDQEQKIYVQHRLLEEGAELYRWIEDGAAVYVCGDAQQMDAAVESAFIEIFRREGKMNEESARQKLREMRREKRYLRDVY